MGEEFLNKVITVVDTSNYRTTEDTTPFKAILIEISDYPCYYVKSVSTGKEYELYSDQIKELAELEQ
jgi:hypothetical protein